MGNKKELELKVGQFIFFLNRQVRTPETNRGKIMSVGQDYVVVSSWHKNLRVKKFDVLEVIK